MLIGVRRVARHCRHDDHLVNGWREDGVEAPGDASPDRTERGLLAPTFEAGGVVVVRVRRFG